MVMLDDAYMTPAVDRKAIKNEARQKAKSKISVNLPRLTDSNDIRELSKAVEKDIFETYYELMMNEEVSDSVRKACADALADRARGKPAGEAPHVAVQINNSFIPDDELVRRINFLSAAAKINGVGNVDS